MKLVCIAGHCGSGKTTAIEIMAQNLPNSAIVRGDLYLKDALLKRSKEFEEIYNIPLDRKQPFKCFMDVSVNASSVKNAERYIKMFTAFIPFIESEIEKAIIYHQKQSKDFILVEHITLPSMKTWAKADYRVIVTSENMFRIKKLKERMTSNYGENEERFTLLSEKTLALFAETANNVDYFIENKYNDNFEKELLSLFGKIVI